MNRSVLLLSLAINVILVSVFGYKLHNNWFEPGVLKLPFRSSIFYSSPVKTGSIMFVGDSHTEAFELNEYLDNPSVRNRGVWGDATSGVAERIDSIAMLKPKKIFLMIGVNDILSGVSPEVAFKNMRSIVSKIRYRSPNTVVLIQSVLPTNNIIKGDKVSALDGIIKLNAMYKTLAMDDKIIFINLYPAFLKDKGLRPDLSFDGLHLSGKGYQQWAGLIKGYL